MSARTGVVDDFATPDRGPPSSATGSSQPLEEKKELSLKDAAEAIKATDLAKPNTVTPTESGCRDGSIAIKKEHHDGSPLQLAVIGQVDSPEDGNKQVRFNGESDLQENKEQSVEGSPSSSSSSQRGLVSRRGGRCGSPGRVTGKSPPKEAVLEFKTYRSPQRVKREESDNVPSLCSSGSADQKDKKRTSDERATQQINVKVEDQGDEPCASKAGDKERDRKPLSISCDSAMIENTSPLASHETEQSQDAKAGEGKVSGNRLDPTQLARKNNVTFSPPPPMREKASERPVRTPTRSPTRSHFQSLPSLDDVALKSPVGIFLSPHPPTPSNYRSIDDMETFGKLEGSKQDEKVASKQDKRVEDNKSYTRSPKTRDQERERFVATPTDFAMDYGKGHPNSASFDTSNVLAWLQSPTGNGLFSPGGGLGSIMNTPRGGHSLGGTGPRTPRTPTVSTSFFFSDVAGLPRSGDYASPRPGGGEGGKRGGTQRGFSNIICISPLASSRSKNGTSHQATTPINYKDVFASPGDKNNPRSLPLLGDSPAKGMKTRGPQRTASRDPSLDAVHMAERDLMEDEDLSVLLQLASNTPRSTSDRPAAVSTSDGTHVFRSPNARKTGSGGDENLPSLQLPMIGGGEQSGNGARLSRKTHSREHNENVGDFKHPPIGMRSGAGELRIGKQKEVSGKDGQGSDDKLNGSKPGTKKPGKKNGMTSGPPTYSMGPPPYSHPGSEVPYYPPMPPGMPPGGSMRVVVGGPPPSRGPKTSGSPHNGPHGPGSPHGHRPYPMGPGDPNYPPPYPHPHYAHHPGVPPPHLQGVPSHHQYHGHYPPPHHPPPRHMPMYGSSHPQPGKSKSTKKPKPTKPPKAGTKRPSPPLQSKNAGSAKKKKSSPSGAPRKKSKSPQLTERGDRQKAAATIQAVNVASGGKNDRAAALAAAILRGVTMRPSGKWQAQLYFAGKSRYIGVFDTREKAALAYEIAREKLKSEKSSAEGGGGLTPKATEAAVNSARKAAFEGVNERDPRLPPK